MLLAKDCSHHLGSGAALQSWGKGANQGSQGGGGGRTAFGTDSSVHEDLQGLEWTVQERALPACQEWQEHPTGRAVIPHTHTHRAVGYG